MNPFAPSPLPTDPQELARRLVDDSVPYYRRFARMHGHRMGEVGPTHTPYYATSAMCDNPGCHASYAIMVGDTSVLFWGRAHELPCPVTSMEENSKRPMTGVVDLFNREQQRMQDLAAEIDDLLSGVVKPK